MNTEDLVEKARAFKTDFERKFERRKCLIHLALGRITFPDSDEQIARRRIVLNNERMGLDLETIFYAGFDLNRNQLNDHGQLVAWGKFAELGDQLAIKFLEVAPSLPYIGFWRMRAEHMIGRIMTESKYNGFLSGDLPIGETQGTNYYLVPGGVK